MKPWYRSSLFWIGLVQTVIAVGEFAVNWLETQTSPDTHAYLLLVTGVATIIRRRFTTKTMYFTAGSLG